MVRISDPERLAWHKEKFTDSAPYIESMGDVTLILTKHLVPIRFHFTEKNRIRSILQETDWLLKEGPSRGGKNVSAKSILEEEDFELFILKTFYELEKGKNIIFLEEESNSMQIAINQGLNLDIFAALTLAPLIEPAVKGKFKGVELAVFFDDLIRKFLIALPDAIKVDPVLIRKRLHNIYLYSQQFDKENSSDDPKNVINRSSDVVSTYHAVMREYHQIGPNLVKSLRLPGKKTLQMGRAHLWYIEKLLRGEQVDPPEKFDEYFARFPEEYTTAYWKMLELMDKS